MPSGIYQIRNQVNGKRYVGSAVNLRRRWREHLGRLRRKQHGNQHLQCAFDKYGEEAFTFSILEHVADSSRLIVCEQDYLDKLKPEYNISPTAASLLGYQHSPGACARISAANKGEQHPMYGKHHSKETRRKMSAAHCGKRGFWRGKRLSAEHRGKLAEVSRGIRRSEETRRKMSLAQKARRHRERTVKNQEERDASTD